ncbi:PadR family transcriptional regulator [Sporolactobacillus sp. KGMB 08714]|uniref:PadR family transcriptional regulator n=1 Tax=Sporolactobacillus sp. KGMB 08714 TaxID=3064704 RepID=UPI002FBE2B35
MYELFILGELKQKPMHGYLLHSNISAVLGPLRPISWGTLYPVLRRMEDDGFIRQIPGETGTGQGRPRKVYELTPSGSSEFERLMQKPFEHNNDTEDLFRVKLSKFQYVSKELQRDILLQYKIFLEMLLSGVEELTERIRKNPNIDEGERPNILTVSDYDMNVMQAKLTWVEKRLASVEAEKNK